MSIGNWYRVGTVAVTNGSVNVVGTGTFWTSQCNPGDRFTVDGENWYEVNSIADDTHLALLSVGGSGAFAGTTASNVAYAIDRNFTNNLNANIAASVASLVAQYQANSNGPLAGLFGNGAAATPGIAFLAEASTGLFHPATGMAALAVQGAEFLRAVGTAAGVPAMLGLGLTAPANALDVFTTNNALYGARIQNSSAGTSARAALQIGNTSAAAQVLNLGVNGASFTANGVLAASRGFVEGPNGVDFASAVTSGTAFSWGVGAAYASKMSMDYQGFLSLASGGKLGVGMTPANVLDITQSLNGISSVSLLNNNAGTGTSGQYTLNNGTSGVYLKQYGSAFSTAGLTRADGGILYAAGAGGLTLATTSAQPLYFGINNAQVAELDASGRLGIGVVPSAWGNFSVIDFANNCAIGTYTGGAPGGIYMASNTYLNGSSAWAYKSTNTASLLHNDGNVLTYQYAASGTAGAAVSWTTGLAIDASGNLNVGTTGYSFHILTKSSLSEGAQVANIGGGYSYGGSANFYITASGGASATATGMTLGKSSSTGRSLSVPGTVNTSGADYAEYRQVIPSLYGAAAKGALLGYDATGLMTNVFANVVGRVLPKSTAPSYVGNDSWGTVEAVVAAYGVAAPGQAPVVLSDPGPGAASDEEIAYDAYLAEEAAYQGRLAAFNAALETERVKWDRVALCGVVPVNISGLTAADIGRYLVPCAAADGTITACAVAKGDLSLGQYIDSFGTIEMIGADGRPLVNVKNG